MSTAVRIPSYINTSLHPHFVEVLKDKLTATYVGKSSHADVGAVQSDNPVSPDCRIYYFEVRILNAAQQPKITVGVACRNFLLNRQPGAESNSVGYRGEDGKKLIGNPNGRPEAYGPSFGKDDVVGCAVHNVKRNIFFTRNGVALDTAVRVSVGELYPTVSMHSPGDKIKFNFQGPFVFDINALIMKEVIEEKKEILKEQILNNDLENLVSSYLLHNGYMDTLAAFRRAISKKNSLNIQRHDSWVNDDNRNEKGHEGIDRINGTEAPGCISNVYQQDKVEMEETKEVAFTGQCMSIVQESITEARFSKTSVDMSNSSDSAASSCSLDCLCMQSSSSSSYSLTKETNISSRLQHQNRAISGSNPSSSCCYISSPPATSSSSSTSPSSSPSQSPSLPGSPVAYASVSGELLIQVAVSESAQYASVIPEHSLQDTTPELPLSLHTLQTSISAVSQSNIQQLHAPVVASFSQSAKKSELIDQVATKSEHDDCLYARKNGFWTETLHCPSVMHKLEKSLAIRKKLKDAIYEGRILQAIEIVEDTYPHLISDYKNNLAVVLLYSQQIIEYLRDSHDNDQVLKAVMWIKDKMSKIFNNDLPLPPSVECALTECCGLISYENPKDSRLSICFDYSRRYLTYHKLNEHILKHELKVPEWSPLHVLMRHLVCCREAIRERNGNRGPKTYSRYLCTSVKVNNTIDESYANLINNYNVILGNKVINK